MDNPSDPVFNRDGTSQEQRLLSALSPDYALVDQRTSSDLLVLADEFAKELVYFNLNNVMEGNWQQFINPDSFTGQDYSDWLQQINSFVQQPENINDTFAANLQRPHFVLFLVFLQLLKNTQTQLNQFAARHLDFYYRQVLDFKLQPPQPDQVNILVTLTDTVDSLLLPAGTLLAAGQDSLGKDLVYGTDSDLVVNHIQIAQLSSVYRNQDNASNWLSLSVYSDVQAEKAPGVADAARWYTFGQRTSQLFTDKTQVPSANIGWAISSPLLCLSQGKRTITLALLFDPDPNQFTVAITQQIKACLASAFRIQLSTASGWITANNFQTELDDYPPGSSKVLFKSLSWTFMLDEKVPALSAINDYDNMLWPTIRLILQPNWDSVSKSYTTYYSLFKDLLLEQALLSVEVNGLIDCKLQNDDQTLLANRPFEPFGSSPAIGARLNFTHPELLVKILSKLEITLPWMGVPSSDLKAYYQNYPAVVNTNSDFKSNISLVDQHLELPLAVMPLFNDDAAKTVTMSIDFESKIPSTYVYERQLLANNQTNVTVWSRYWVLELSEHDFQHSAYPAVAAAKAVDFAVAISNKTVIQTKSDSTTTPDDYKVNPPYTPKLKNFSINYSASIALTIADLQSQDADQIFHCHPFGYAPMPVDPVSGGYKFLPDYENEGELYIGLSRVATPQTLSILMQMAEGTANPDIKRPATVTWSVLDNNSWKPLDQGQLLHEGTNGLRQTGILRFQLNAVAPSTLLPPGLYWLRAAASGNCDSLCDTVSINTQAVSATFINQGNSEDHLNQPLPANTIKDLVKSRADIASISQPYTSFGARPKEQDSDFYTRISERLRHKQRALSYWDYECLTLEEFPEIYKAKAIPAGILDNSGKVTVVVIPDIRKHLPFNPFEPKVPSGVLLNIGTYLSGLAPDGADITVKNAHFRAVKLRFGVLFQPGCDFGFYKQQLNQEINSFLSPWAFDQGEDIVIGGKIYANAIINFIERRPYVDHVEKLKLFLANENGDGYTYIPKSELNADNEGYAVSANHADAVLVADNTHVIDNLSDITKLIGINYMMIGLDFIVGDIDDAA